MTHEPENERPETKQPDNQRDETDTSSADVLPENENENENRPEPESDSSPSRALLRVGLPSLAMAGGALALEWLRVGFQNRRMFKPDAPVTDANAIGPEGDASKTGETETGAVDETIQDQWFDTTDGVKLHGWWIPHRNAPATVLFCHGNTGNIGYYQGVFRQLRRLGVSIFGFDYRGYGQSAGKPSEAGLYLDAQAAWNHVTAGLGVDPNRVLLFGHSLGGAVAIDLAVRAPIPALIVQSTFTDMRTMARQLHSPAHLVAKNAFRSIAKVSALSMPKLFIHGDADPKIPLAMGRALYEAAADPKAWYAVAGGLHNDLHRAGGDDYLQTLARYIDAHFR